MPVFDRRSRPLRNLRLSVTDRCNLRCAYCMPEENYVWLPRRDVLSFEEISFLVDCFSDVGVDKLRLTGGEPLLRHDVAALVEILSGKPAIRDLAMTTNGLMLEEQAPLLAAAGLHRLTVSLDTLQRDRFRALTRRDALPRVIAGIDAAAAAGFTPIKLDSVIMRGVNDDEICDLIDFAREKGAELRCIEYMDVGGATKWKRDLVVSRTEMLERVARRFGTAVPVDERTSAPADRYVLDDGTIFGIISSTTQPFCATCDRARLTADGMWYLCLYAALGTDFRALVRSGASREEIADAIGRVWGGRSDRGAEERLRDAQRSALCDSEALRRDPHLEMHTRGG